MFTGSTERRGNAKIETENILKSAIIIHSYMT